MSGGVQPVREDSVRSDRKQETLEHFSKVYWDKLNYHREKGLLSRIHG